MWSAWAPVWRNRERWNGWAVPAAAVLGIGLLGGGAYFVAARFNAWRGVTVWDPELAWEGSLPILPWTVLPYSTFYFYFLLAAAAAPNDDRGRAELLRVSQMLLWIAWVSVAFFLAFPCEIFPAARDELRDGAWGPVFRMLHGVDPAWNAWPSLHVSQSLAITLAVARWWRRGDARTRWASERPGLWTALLGLAWVALCVSTSTTRQHYVFDVFSAIALGLVAWWVVRPLAPTQGMRNPARSGG